jgi:hypothetical protein
MTVGADFDASISDILHKEVFATTKPLALPLQNLTAFSNQDQPEHSLMMCLRSKWAPRQRKLP